MTPDMPLMPEELMGEFGVTSGHPYYDEIRCLISMGYILEMTGKALIEAPKRSRHIDIASLEALDGYITTLSELAEEIYELRQ